MRTLTTLSDLSDYFAGVSARLADHGVFRRVVQTLAFEFYARLAPNEPLYVRTYNTNLGNQIIFRLQNGRTLKATYHGRSQEISVRDADTQQTLRNFHPDDDIEAIAAWCRDILSAPVRAAA
jgi:hypothetical protein